MVWLSPVSMTTRSPSRAQIADRLRRFRLDRIGNAQQSGGATVDRSEDDRLALRAHLFGLRASVRLPHRSPVSCSSCFVAGRDFVPADACRPRRVR